MRLSLPAIVVVTASGILPACREKLVVQTVGGVEMALPNWKDHGKSAETDNGYIDKQDARGSRVAVYWDIDPRPGAVSWDEARLAISAPEAQEAGGLSVAGHPGRLLRTARGSAAVWRCDKTARILRVISNGSFDAGELAQHVRCHAVAPTANGDVPAAASTVLGTSWTYANRNKGSISWMRDDAVLTYFAGSTLPGPRDADAARKAAPAWVAAAGLNGAEIASAEPAPGPQGHPAVLVHGTATLQNRPVRWSLLFWRCLQRQKSFAAIVFSQAAPEDSALLSARCHG